ncbi:membrane protein [Mycolicibacterium canariasense]|uniref:Membrane protein n=1 Tax=Mycolicibacterium canariasense TaxID=228230 RepID=A0A100WIS0_MYCCR|nr:DUF6328 family protein [Mycolicibacterium canariasense]MCV7208205.1 sodium:proton antiporter [Mycolicibacterium canariasense]ORV09458.1 sodium:proton antiporter [Mycolicibacterium canariasense]GAS99051.1 membrane protein [Mycolicibacterium canariasense]
MGVDVDHPERDQQWNNAARGETAAQRLDRNWSSLLQELRVVETGVQLLTGLLLMLPFQNRFDRLDAAMRVVYLITVSCSLGATMLLVAPIGMHRMMFRRHRLDVIVAGAHRLAYYGLMLLALALAGVSVLIFDVVVGSRAGILAGGVTALALIGLWLVLPLVLRTRPPP